MLGEESGGPSIRQRRRLGVVMKAGVTREGVILAGVAVDRGAGHARERRLDPPGRLC
jgi:hypothetical protein